MRGMSGKSWQAGGSGRRGSAAKGLGSCGCGSGDRGWGTGLFCRSVVAIVCLLSVASAAWGTASGLNNIPTADVPPTNVLVVQGFSNVSHNTRTDHFVGLKYGVLDGLEFGVDWKASGEPHSHLTYQVKYAFDITEDLLRGAVGVANVSENESDTGNNFPYVVTSWDFKDARGHLGFTAQDDNEGFFAGFDTTFPVIDRDFMVRLDAIQTNEMRDMLYSAGFIYNLKANDSAGSGEAGEKGEAQPKGLLEKITSNMLFESWISIPSTSAEEVVTFKLNYVIEF